MKRRWIFWILVVLFIWVVISQLSAIRKLVETLLSGQWQWVAIAAIIQVIYYINYAAIYQSAFLTVGVKSRIRDLVPLTFASIFMNVAAPSGGASRAGSGRRPASGVREARACHARVGRGGAVGGQSPAAPLRDRGLCSRTCLAEAAGGVEDARPHSTHHGDGPTLRLCLTSAGRRSTGSETALDKATSGTMI